MSAMLAVSRLVLGSPASTPALNGAPIEALAVDDHGLTRFGVDFAAVWAELPNTTDTEPLPPASPPTPPAPPFPPPSPPFLPLDDISGEQMRERLHRLGDMLKWGRANVLDEQAFEMLRLSPAELDELYTLCRDLAKDVRDDPCPSPPSAPPPPPDVGAQLSRLEDLITEWPRSQLRAEALAIARSLLDLPPSVFAEPAAAVAANMGASASAAHVL